MIRLIDRDEKQKNWALVIQGSVPTIDAYKRNPHLFNTIPHGLYEIDCNIKNLRDADNGFQCWPDGISNGAIHVKVLTGHVNLMKQIAAQTLWYNEDIVSMRGRFDKRGSEILFILGAE
ncbi:hypothetical protein AU156_gp199 [Edwardsiella phage PEi20]|uniref:Uncharacterized protein n=1 Tax=Edwardsiella phage PEi20 TaxID=1608310 RepID=A0A0B6VLC2_9CAUD|nr:hypothetical protein AU156_gp199 [Edwardsiella phage PEi20]BAQ22902.1 conserved hypothetical protein [Edwardsiella phage PEi20]